MTNIAINGFGRIGRNVLRAYFENFAGNIRGKSSVNSGNNDLNIIAINDLASPENMAHLFKYDSTHGQFNGNVEVKTNDLIINGKTIKITAIANPAELPWGDLDIDIVLECSGRFNSHEKASAHIQAGAKKVLLSAPASDADKTIVFGVNHRELTADHRVVSNASCTTNCLAPVAKVLHEAIGIEQGIMTTIHAYTGDQRILDSDHSDLRRARAAGLSMIPTSTGAAKAVGLVLPELNGKLDGFAIRVPTANVSLVDLTFIPSRKASVEEINKAVFAATNNNIENGGLQGVLAYNDLPLVSVDMNHNSASSIFDATQTRIIDCNSSKNSTNMLVKILAWYDNEWGFSNRMLDTALYMGKL